MNDINYEDSHYEAFSMPHSHPFWNLILATSIYSLIPVTCVTFFMYVTKLYRNIWTDNNSYFSSLRVCWKSVRRSMPLCFSGGSYLSSTDRKFSGENSRERARNRTWSLLTRRRFVPLSQTDGHKCRYTKCRQDFSL